MNSKILERYREIATSGPKSPMLRVSRRGTQKFYTYNEKSDIIFNAQAQVLTSQSVIAMGMSGRLLHSRFRLAVRVRLL